MDVAASGELAGRGDLDGDLSDGDFSCDLGGDGGGITTWPVPGMLPAAARDAGFQSENSLATTPPGKINATLGTCKGGLSERVKGDYWLGRLIQVRGGSTRRDSDSC